MTITRTLTASMLFANNAHNPGPYSCYYCGADCDGAHPAKTHVKDTFTNRDIVKYPASGYVCAGCVMSTGDGSGDMPMLDGTVKTFTTPRGMAPRMYSWLITSTGYPPGTDTPYKLAFTKAHISIIRGILTDPEQLPPPPFAVILSESGQKQLIFRAPVALSTDNFPVMLEDETIDMSPERLSARLELAGRISVKLGKPTLRETPGMTSYITARKAGVSEKDLMMWASVMHEPLSRLAAWLAPPKIKE
ncbi:MAG: hypothetical protein FWE62_04805 [Firmicutes bacterium]|nr:hypothetical protein [Bacillota bacterium]